MSMVKLDLEQRTSVPPEQTNLSGHYHDVALRTLRTIARHWGFIWRAAGLTLALATVSIPFIPRKYSAVALVYPNLFTEEQGRRLPRASIDATSFVTGELRLMLSDGILAEVEKRLQLSGKADSSESLIYRATSWLRSLFLPETRSYSAADRAIIALRNKIEISKDPRAYVITISYVGRSAEEAANVVNAVALEYRRDKAMRHRQEAVAAAEGELRQQLASYGDKHPKVLLAQTELEAALAAFASVAGPGESRDEAAGGGETVKLAKPTRTPASPNGSMIMGFSLLLGLLAALGWVLWCDRRGRDPKDTLYTMSRGHLVTSARIGARVYADVRAWLRRVTSQQGLQLRLIGRADGQAEHPPEGEYSASKYVGGIPFGLLERLRRMIRLRADRDDQDTGKHE